MLNKHSPNTKINFSDVQETATKLADTIESNYQDLINILLVYESFEVATDEIERSLDLLRNIHENEGYFKLRVGPIVSFMPRNQPLYALTCFVVVPALMASEVHFRIPHTMKHFLRNVIDLLDISAICPNVHVSSKERLEFLTEQSALLENPQTGKTVPISKAVIFTGTYENAEKLRLVFDKQTLFISNGSGHNPIVISEDASLDDAVEAVTTLNFYNQGQDCAAPNAILVHKNVIDEFMRLLREKIKTTRVGNYSDRECRVGPISDPEDLIRIQEFLVENREWIDPAAPGIFNTKDSIVYPTIICKPLKLGGNYQEMFAPVIFVQEYAADEELNLYFDNSNYTLNAMYVTLYGNSNYIESIVNQPLHGQTIHDKHTFIHNKHLHQQGVERGTQPYGGYGKGASSISFDGRTIAKPTLPQRDIYEWLVAPMETNVMPDLSAYTKVVHKNVSKLLKIKADDLSRPKHEIHHNNDIYLDLHLVKNNLSRYVKLNYGSLFPLLHEPNTKFLATLELKEVDHIRQIRPLLKSKASLTYEEFETRLYAIPRENTPDTINIRVLQKRFFQNIYQLLFGRDDGPRLAEFLWNIDESKIDALLDVTHVHN